MTIQRQTFLYDITARFGPGGFIGAHAIDLERVIDGEEILSEKELPARAITEREFQDVFEGKAATLLEAVGHARSERDDAVANALRRAREADKAKELAERRLAEKTQEVQALTQVIVIAAAQVQSMAEKATADQQAELAKSLGALLATLSTVARMGAR